MRVTTESLLAVASIAMLCCLGAAQEASGQGATSLDSMVEALERTQARIRPKASYQVIREYRLFGANDSSANSTVVAEVDFSPPAHKNYRIQISSGSSRGEQVVRRVLDNEVEAGSNGNQARSALTRENYEFTYTGEAVLDGQPCYLLGLKPKRKEKNLIAGQAWVDKHLFLVHQIEGEVAKTPSWWLKKVRVKLTFEDVDGTWLQSNMEAVADVRMVGLHTLTSHTLDYRGANEVASTGTRMHHLDRKP